MSSLFAFRSFVVYVSVFTLTNIFITCLVYHTIHLCSKRGLFLILLAKYYYFFVYSTYILIFALLPFYCVKKVVTVYFTKINKHHSSCHFPVALYRLCIYCMVLLTLLQVCGKSTDFREWLFSIDIIHIMWCFHTCEV